MAINKVLKATTDSELLSFIINSDPLLSSEIDLPVQGESIKPIGELISSDERYKNAFINTVNLIGLTLIKRNAWNNPWENFTQRGTLRFGQQVREMILDLCNVYDYNKNITDETRFLETVVPNVFNYIHEVNFQKFYQTTTSDEQLAMAFDTEGGLFDFIDKAISMLYESWKYDKYIVDKYMLCRRIINGTMTPSYIENYNTLTNREKVSALKNVSNLMTFRSPNYNPAGVRRATPFEDQITIVNTKFEADFSTDVLATSYFRDEADMKSRLALIDGFDNHDTARLQELLEEAYIPFTNDELETLKNIPAVTISREFFMDYLYAMNNESGLKTTQFYNPTTLKNNHFLHVWGVFSTSPFENNTVFTTVQPAVTSVAVSPNESSVSAGLSVQLNATVVTTGFANKAVTWSVTKADGQVTPVTVDMTGKVNIPADFSVAGSGEAQIEITATSVYDPTVKGTATITVL